MSELEVNTGTALSISIPVALFAALMPPVSDLWMTKNGTVTARMAHTAEIVAGTISLSVALVISAMVDSATPFLLTTLITAAIASAYEYILRRDILDNVA